MTEAAIKRRDIGRSQLILCFIGDRILYLHHSITSSPGTVFPKLAIGRESEFRNMNPFSRMGVVPLEFRGSPDARVIV
jgi:hypothetical protein